MKKIEINRMEKVQGGGCGATTFLIMAGICFVSIGAVTTGIGAAPAVMLVGAMINHYESGCLK